MVNRKKFRVIIGGFVNARKTRVLKLNVDKGKLMVLRGQEGSVWMGGNWRVFRSLSTWDLYEKNQAQMSQNSSGHGQVVCEC